MRILIANKYLYPRGGDCIFTLRLMELLSSRGHEVIPFTMNHPQNIKTEYDRFFVPYIDFREELAKKSFKNIASVIGRAIINSQAVQLMDELIQYSKPDIVHLNNIHHQLTPAIIKAPAKYNIPIVWTLHDYTLNCPDSTFLRNGRNCRKCSKGNYFNAIIHRCKKGSLGASLIAAIECGLYSPARISPYIDKFISPSRFLAERMIEDGLSAEKIVNLPNFLLPLDIESKGNNYFIYVGRLSEEKGVESLVKAFLRFGKGKLLIVGDGHLKGSLERMAQKSKTSIIEFIGHKPLNEVYELMANSLGVIIPSICWDNFPNVVLEAMAIGKPVIGAKTGGIPEQIDDGITGCLFEPGNIDQLTECLDKIFVDSSKAAAMGRAGRDKACREYTSEKYYNKILKVYQEAYDKHKRPIANNFSRREAVPVG